MIPSPRELRAQPAPARASAPHNLQDQRALDRINQNTELLLRVQGDAELLAALQPAGYDAAALREGQGVCERALNAFTARQEAGGAQRTAKSAQDSTAARARVEYRAFRSLGRALFKNDPGTLAALGLTDPAATDLQRFVGSAMNGYDAALGNPAALSALARRGFGEQPITAARALLDTLQGNNAAHTQARAAARQATTDRRAATKAMDDWMAELRAAAVTVLRNSPDMMARFQS